MRPASLEGPVLLTTAWGFSICLHTFTTAEPGTADSLVETPVTVFSYSPGPL